MFFKFLSLHNCIWNNLYLILKGTIFFLIFIRYFISLIRYIFSIISVQSNIFIFNFHSRSFRHIFSFSQPPPKRKRWERVCRNQTNEMEQKKKKKRLRGEKAATTVAWHTIRIRPISCTWSEFLSNSSKRCTGTREEPDSSWIVSKIINTCSSTCVCIYVSCVSLYVCEESTVRISNSYYVYIIIV